VDAAKRQVAFFLLFVSIPIFGLVTLLLSFLFFPHSYAKIENTSDSDVTSLVVRHEGKIIEEIGRLPAGESVKFSIGPDWTLRVNYMFKGKQVVQEYYTDNWSGETTRFTVEPDGSLKNHCQG
jgi:hypothetical protein